MLSGTIFISFAVIGIRDFRMSRMSGIEISSSQGLKKPPKLSPLVIQKYKILDNFRLRKGLALIEIYLDRCMYVLGFISK